MCTICEIFNQVQLHNTISIWKVNISLLYDSQSCHSHESALENIRTTTPPSPRSICLSHHGQEQQKIQEHRPSRDLPSSSTTHGFFSRRPAAQPIIDTHTHLVSTFSTYRSKYRDGTIYTIHDFVHEMYHNRNVRAIVDVWCDAPVLQTWRELADSALTAEDRASKWGGIDYWFVMGERSRLALLSTSGLRRSDRRPPVCIAGPSAHASR